MRWFLYNRATPLPKEERSLRDEEGATAVEYAVMLTMVLMALFSAIGMVGGQTGGMWGRILQQLHAFGF